MPECINVRNLSRDNELLADRVRHCRRFWDRCAGLLIGLPLAAKEACWIIPCRAIHTFGMKYPIDAYFLNKENTVVAVLNNFKHNQLSPIYLAAHSVLEFSSDPERNCRVGDRLFFGEAL